MPDFEQLEPLRDLPQTKRGHERCLALLLSANRLFLEKGYDAVSLDDIVNHAGGSKASIYKYFGNKEGLFTAICDYRREQFFKDISLPFNQAGQDLRCYLVDTLISFYQHIIQPENAAFLRLILEQSQRNTELAHYIHDHGPKEIQQSLAHALQTAHDHQLIFCKNPVYSAQMYFGILRNLEWRVLLGLPLPHPEHKIDQETLKYINYCVDVFLDGHQKV